MSALRAAWSTMSTVQRQGWDQLALQVQLNTATSGQYPRRAYALFIQFNYLPYALTDVIELTSPQTFKTDRITSFTATVNDSPSVLVATVFPGGVGTKYQQISIRLGMRGKQRSAFTHWVVFGFESNASSLLDLTAEYLALFGNPVLGQIYEMKATMQRPGLFPSSSPIFQGTTV
jgi:hypothetical protein